MRRVQRIDDVGLYLRDGVGVLEMLRKGFDCIISICWERGARVGGSNGEWTAEQNGCPAVVDEDDSPQPDAQLTFFVCEDALSGCGVGLYCRVMV